MDKLLDTYNDPKLKQDINHLNRSIHAMKLKLNNYSASLSYSGAETEMGLRVCLSRPPKKKKKKETEAAIVSQKRKVQNSQNLC
jgi:hypothetical protein